jgi:hypothetical protein
MRERGLAPSLIVTPISWRLQHELGLEDFRRSPTQHALVPLAHANDFIGIIDDVPVLDLAPLAEDRLWVLDLPAFMRMVEWPSENDSGVSFELRIFDANQAVEFIAQHPEVRGTRSAEETALDLQEKVLISVHLCWLLQALEPDAAVAVEVPEEFRRD